MRLAGRKLKLVFRCDADGSIGFGHLKRALAIAEWASAPASFAIRNCPDQVRRLLAEGGHRVVDISGSSVSEAAIIKNETPDAVVVDLPSRRYRREFSSYLGSLSEAGLRLVVFDGMGADAMLDAPSATKVMLAVRPYAGARPECLGTWLAGPEYFILPANYARPESPRRAANPARVLLTTGGGDPGFIAKRVITALAGISDRHLMLRVVQGPVLSKAARLSASQAAMQCPHEVEFVGPREDLVEDLLWCDLAIATTGLTKYELAYFGIPAILISPDEAHEEAHASYRQADSAVSLGCITGVSDDEIRAAVRELLDNEGLRERLSLAGRRLIDGQGGRRLLRRIYDEVTAC